MKARSGRGRFVTNTSPSSCSGLSRASITDRFYATKADPRQKAEDDVEIEARCVVSLGSPPVPTTPNLHNPAAAADRSGPLRRNLLAIAACPIGRNRIDRAACQLPRLGENRFDIGAVGPLQRI